MESKSYILFRSKESFLCPGTLILLHGILEFLEKELDSH